MLSAVRHKRLSVVRCLVILAVLPRALIPAGFMLDVHATNKLFPLVICSGLTGTTTVYLPAAKLPVVAEAGKQTGSEQKRHQGNGDNAPCAFSAMFACGMTEASPQLAELVFRKTPSHLFGSADTLAKIPSKTYFSQGPPSFLLRA
jgi:hypothetical protein